MSRQRIVSCALGALLALSGCREAPGPSEREAGSAASARAPDAGAAVAPQSASPAAAESAPDAGATAGRQPASPQVDLLKLFSNPGRMDPLPKGIELKPPPAAELFKDEVVDPRSLERLGSIEPPKPKPSPPRVGPEGSDQDAQPRQGQRGTIDLDEP